MSNVLDWLLEDENPAVKYRTLIEIFDKNSNDYQNLYERIWAHKQIVKLISKQDEKGLWGIKDIRDITTIQHLTVFAEYGLYKDSRFDRYVDFIINLMQSWRDDSIDVFSCYAPMALRALVMMGYSDRSDVMELIQNFAKTQIYDGGFMCKRRLDKKPERKSCYKAAVSGLLLYAACKRKNISLPNTDNLVNYFIKRGVFYSTDKTHVFIDQHGVPKGFPSILMKIGIPLFISALSILGAGNNPGLQEVWAMMKEKEDENGRFKQEGASAQVGFLGKDGHENRWSTFYALLAEKYRTV